MTIWITCPKQCGGEKALEENRIPWDQALAQARGDREMAWRISKWSPDDGFVIDPEFSCECALTEEEDDQLQLEADARSRERAVEFEP